MSDELKPLDKVVDQYGDMGQLVSRVDDERWIVFDYDIDDEMVWNVAERKARVVSGDQNERLRQLLIECPKVEYGILGEQRA